jgi:uncharacterized membrane protein YgaE (UPF0421/DUF939 family)
MENSIASTYKAGGYRLIGTLVGAFTGVIFVSIQPGNALLMGIGTMVLIFICSAFKWDRAVPIAGVMFAAIMLSLNNKNPLQYSFSRVLDTFVGIVVAVAVNYFIFPPNNLVQMRNNLDAISDKISKSITEFICEGKQIDLNGLRSEVINSVKFLEAYKTEFNPIDGVTEFSKIGDKLESLRNILSHFKTVAELGPQCRLSPENIEKLKRLNFCKMETGEYKENSQNIIFNYHVGKVLENLLHLSQGSIP